LQTDKLPSEKEGRTNRVYGDLLRAPRRLRPSSSHQDQLGRQWRIWCRETDSRNGQIRIFPGLQELTAHDVSRDMQLGVCESTCTRECPSEVSYSPLSLFPSFPLSRFPSFPLSLLMYDCRLEREGEYERAAAMAVFHLDVRRAVTALNRGSSSSTMQDKDRGTNFYCLYFIIFYKIIHTYFLTI
jgi:hypothetical protein